MAEITQVQVVTEATVEYRVPVNVPTPTNEYRTHRKYQKAIVEPGAPVPAAVPGPIPPTLPPLPIPPILLTGPRVLMWKQDPAVGEIGIRKVYLPGFAQTGPKDARITSQGLPAVSANAFGDFIQTPGTDSFDVVHTFAVVRATLNMYQRALGKLGHPVPWQWNGATNSDPISVFAHGLPGTMNAYYSRNEKALRFGDFLPPAPPSPTPLPPVTPTTRVFTCRSLDIVAHETGHAVLDGLKPGWLGFGNPPQTGGLHESFGDLTAIFLALSQLDQVEAVIAQTKANLHDKTFLSDLAEQFGLALGRPNGLRNADNNLKLSQVGTEVHAISQVWTGCVYDIIASIFAFERNAAKKDDAAVLYEVAQYVCSLLLRAIIASPANGATYANVATNMLTIANSDGKPAQYRAFIRNHCTVREIIVPATPFAFTDNMADDDEVLPGIQDDPNAVQDRRTCCGTMQLDEYIGKDELVKMEADELMKFFATSQYTDAQVQKNGHNRATANKK